jgi:hypothetical protein
VSAGIARHGAEALAEHVHNLALAFVAPLGAKHYRSLCSHGHPFFSGISCSDGSTGLPNKGKNQAELPDPHHFR